jgi:hypothetical protein
VWSTIPCTDKNYPSDSTVAMRIRKKQESGLIFQIFSLLEVQILTALTMGCHDHQPKFELEGQCDLIRMRQLWASMYARNSVH